MVLLVFKIFNWKLKRTINFKIRPYVIMKNFSVVFKNWEVTVYNK
jgi:hypothetical protein